MGFDDLKYAELLATPPPAQSKSWEEPELGEIPQVCEQYDKY
jgi:hypothetical protein